MIDISARQPQTAVLEWEVVDLLLSDDRLVGEMFEDIIATEWPPIPDAPSVNPPDIGAGPSGGDQLGPSRPGARSASQHRAHRPGTDGWARERSPPKRPARQP
jgi:hypothetical protein